MTFKHYIAMFLWFMIAFGSIGLLSLICTGGIWSLCGLSIALNCYLSWHYAGHENMLHYLGLKE